jgi:hypothetical protein
LGIAYKHFHTHEVNQHHFFPLTCYTTEHSMNKIKRTANQDDPDYKIMFFARGIIKIIRIYHRRRDEYYEEKIKRNFLVHLRQVPKTKFTGVNQNSSKDMMLKFLGTSGSKAGTDMTGSDKTQSNIANPFDSNRKPTVNAPKSYRSYFKSLNVSDITLGSHKKFQIETTEEFDMGPRRQGTNETSRYDDCIDELSLPGNISADEIAVDALLTESALRFAEMIGDKTKDKPLISVKDFGEASSNNFSNPSKKNFVKKNYLSSRESAILQMKIERHGFANNTEPSEVLSGKNSVNPKKGSNKEFVRYLNFHSVNHVKTISKLMNSNKKKSQRNIEYDVPVEKVNTSQPPSRQNMPTPRQTPNAPKLTNKPPNPRKNPYTSTLAENLMTSEYAPPTQLFKSLPYDITNVPTSTMTQSTALTSQRDQIPTEKIRSGSPYTIDNFSGKQSPKKTHIQPNYNKNLMTKIAVNNNNT